MRDAGLLDALAARGVEVADVGDVEAFRWAPDPGRPARREPGDRGRPARQVAALVAGADSTVLVLGGDCTVELGTVAGCATGWSGSGSSTSTSTPISTSRRVSSTAHWTGWGSRMLDVEGAESGSGRHRVLAPAARGRPAWFLGVKPGTEFEQATIGSVVSRSSASTLSPRTLGGRLARSRGTRGMRRRRGALRRRPRELPRRAAAPRHGPRGGHARGRRHRLARPDGRSALPRADRDRARPVPRRRDGRRPGDSSRCSLAPS